MLTQQQRAEKYGKTPTNHPGHIMERFGFFTDVDKEGAQGALADVQRAHQHVTKTWTAIHGLLEAASRDPSQNEAAKLKSVASEARKAADRATQDAQGSIKHAQDSIKMLEADIRAASRPPNATEAALDAEIRAYLRTLSPGDAFAKIMEAKSEDHDYVTLLRAASSGPAFLTGMTPDMQAQCRQRFHEHIKPEQVEGVARLRKGIAIQERAINALAEHVNDHVDFATADGLRALEMKPIKLGGV